MNININYNHRTLKDRTIRKRFKQMELKINILKSVVSYAKVANSKRLELNELLQLLGKSSYTKVRNRCLITGRATSVYRDLKLNRHMFKQQASNGMLPGIIKSSW